MENNYSVYQHVTPDGMYYFGATQNVERRWSNNGAEYKRTALQPYIEKFGWDNIKHIVLFKDQTRENALWIEDFLITTAQEDGVCINKNRSGNISKEEGYKQRQSKQYRERNKDKILEYQNEYYEQNKEQIRGQQKQYYEQNKQEILEQQKQYYEQNKQQIREQRRQWYQKNRDEINEQRRQRYQKNRDEINERRRQRYQRKKEEKQFKELGNLPLW